MRLSLKLTSLMMVSLLLIILTSSCATPAVSEKGWTPLLENGKVIGYKVTPEAGRIAAQDKAENKLLKEEVKDNPSFTEKIIKNWAVFSAGGAAGVIGAVWLGL